MSVQDRETGAGAPQAAWHGFSSAGQDTEAAAKSTLCSLAFSKMYLPSLYFWPSSKACTCRQTLYLSLAQAALGTGCCVSVCMQGERPGHTSLPPNLVWQSKQTAGAHIFFPAEYGLADYVEGFAVASGRAHIHPAQHGLAVYAGYVCHAVQAGHQQTLLLGPEGDVDPARPPPCRACWPAQPRGPRAAKRCRAASAVYYKEQAQPVKCEERLGNQLSLLSMCRP